MNKNGKKWRILMKKIGFKTTSSHFLGTYELDFSCSSIFYQPWARLRHFKGKKVQLIFHPISAIFSPPGRLPKAITTPWKCPLRVPWWNTFQWGPRKPPKPLLPKKISSSEILNYTPSPLCPGPLQSHITCLTYNWRTVISPIGPTMMKYGIKDRQMIWSLFQGISRRLKTTAKERTTWEISKKSLKMVFWLIRRWSLSTIFSAPLM